MSAHPYGIELDPSGGIAAIISGTTAGKVESVHLTFDSGLIAGTRVRIAESFASATAELSRGTDIPTLVLLQRIDLPYSGRTQQRSTLSCRHRLQKVIIVQVHFGFGGVAGIVLAVAFVAGRDDVGFDDVPFGTELLQELSVDAPLLVGVFVQRERPHVTVAGAHAQGASALRRDAGETLGAREVVHRHAVEGDASLFLAFGLIDVHVLRQLAFQTASGRFLLVRSWQWDGGCRLQLVLHPLTGELFESARRNRVLLQPIEEGRFAVALWQRGRRAGRYLGSFLGQFRAQPGIGTVRSVVRFLAEFFHGR